jgi:hypothetical protein
MACSSVQELRPRTSTSGGQSDGRACGEAMTAAAGEVLSAALVAVLGLLPVMANQEATSVQVRHLTICVSHDIYCCDLHMAVESAMASGASSVSRLTVCHRDQARRPWAASSVLPAHHVAFRPSLPVPVPSSLLKRDFAWL